MTRALPLKDVSVIELAGLAPGPFAGMILADFGASVIRVDKLRKSVPPDSLTRSIALELKSAEGIRILHQLLSKADVLIDPFRPGVLEQLLNMDMSHLSAKYPRLIIARLTGFGQTGPLSKKAGHDLTYIAISGVLSLLGTSDQPPAFPANLLGDFAGGSTFCVIGILLALLERGRSGRGQVVDASMVDGALYLSSFILKMRQAGLWGNPRGHNLLDGGAPFYRVYRTKDDGFLAIAAIEPQFYKEFLKGLDLDPRSLPAQMDPLGWSQLESIFSKRIASKKRDEWIVIFNPLDACVTPVLSLDELPMHPHHLARSSLMANGDPAPCPRLDQTPASMSPPSPLESGQNSIQILQELGYSRDLIQELISRKHVRDRSGRL